MGVVEDAAEDAAAEHESWVEAEGHVACHGPSAVAAGQRQQHGSPEAAVDGGDGGQEQGDNMVAEEGGSVKGPGQEQ